MLTPLQKRKLTRYFNILDLGAKGFIEEEDIFTINLRLANKKGIHEGTPEWKGVRDNIDMIWKYSHQYGLTGDPDKVFLIDWLAHENFILADEWYRENYLRKISRDVFHLFMNPDNQKLYKEDYCELISCFGVEDGVRKWAFDKMDVENNGYFTEHEFITLVEDFHLSNSKNTHENYLFGSF